MSIYAQLNTVSTKIEFFCKRNFLKSCFDKASMYLLQNIQKMHKKEKTKIIHNPTSSPLGTATVK